MNCCDRYIDMDEESDDVFFIKDEPICYYCLFDSLTGECNMTEASADELTQAVYMGNASLLPLTPM